MQLHRRVDCREELRPIAALRPLERGHHAVLEHPGRRLGRHLARHAQIERRTERVDIGPRPLRADIARVLLLRGVALLYDTRQRPAHVGDDTARGAEVEQHGRTVGTDDDVVRRDVAMQEVGFVHHLDRIEQRPQQAVELLLSRRPPEALQPGFHARSALEPHDHIGGAVRLEHADHAHDGRVIELRERARLAQEARPQAVEQNLVVV